jgi:hypothetical protein
MGAGARRPLSTHVRTGMCDLNRGALWRRMGCGKLVCARAGGGGGGGRDPGRALP